MMCLRLAEYKNEGNLAYKFWNKKPWDWTFKQQLFTANSLIKKYGELAVVKAVNSPYLSKVFSLKHKSVVPEIKKQLKILEEQAKRQKEKEDIEVKDNPQTRKKSYGKKSKLNKLRELKNGKKESEE